MCQTTSGNVSVCLVIYIYSNCVSVCVLDGRMRQTVSILPEGHVASDEPPPNTAPTLPLHTPGGYTGNTHTHTMWRGTMLLWDRNGSLFSDIIDK